MGSLFRSEETVLCQLFLQNESAYASVSKLGELGLVQFRDANANVNAFQRRFINQVRRCEEMERKLRFVEREITKAEIVIKEVVDESPAAPLPKELIDLEAELEELENDLQDVSKNSEELKKTYCELTELKYILIKAQTFFDDQETSSNMDPSIDQAALVSSDIQTTPTQLGFIAGVISKERVVSFEKMLWRVSRGNVFLKQADMEKPVEDPFTGEKVMKVVFVLFFQGEQLKNRIKKICDGFRAILYPCPETLEEREAMLTGVKTRMEDLIQILNKTQDHQHGLLVHASKSIKLWMIKVFKMKAIYHTMNMFNMDVTKECLIAECWICTRNLSEVQQAMKEATDETGSNMPSIVNPMDTKEQPPTYNILNKFTSGFQAIVDAYGVGTYMEVNPTPYTLITFPFLFAVMFGDCGHGLLMALFGLYMVVKEKQIIAAKSDNEIWNTMFNGRYIILLMGTFSIYTGFIYNDIFSKSFNIFGCRWTLTDYYEKAYEKDAKFVQLDPEEAFKDGKPYPIGIDPIWQAASNKILFLNSYKMKVSIVFGVTQMSFGVILSLWNHVHFGRYINVFCEFIPQLIFLWSIFGYLCVIIFFKWIVFGAHESFCVPSLLITLINMFLMKYVDDPCYLKKMYSGQKLVQTILVLTALICIPWMLLVKPLIMHCSKKKRQPTRLQETPSEPGKEEKAQPKSGGKEKTPPESGGEEETSPESEEQEETPSKSEGQKKPPPKHGEEEEESFGDLFIHQAIHTIEYCLGSISHTASYLRLWALSLAHAELSEVLWGMVLKIALSQTAFTGAIMMYFIFGAWACLTIGILLIMEGLSAFLHALRLHWVEFQSKFYDGQGYPFVPFSFSLLLAKEEA